MAFIQLPYPNLSREIAGVDPALLHTYEKQRTLWDAFLDIPNKFAEVEAHELGIKVDVSIVAARGLAFMYRDPRTPPSPDGLPFDLLDDSGQAVRWIGVPRGSALPLTEVKFRLDTTETGPPEAPFTAYGSHDDLTVVARFRDAHDLGRFVGIGPYPLPSPVDSPA